MNKLTYYLQDVYKEMQKVNWPKQSDLVNNTIITLVGTIVISLFIYLADQAISRMLGFIYQ